MCAMLGSAGSFPDKGGSEAWLAKKAPEGDPEDEELEDDLEGDEDEWDDEVDGLDADDLEDDDLDDDDEDDDLDDDLIDLDDEFDTEDIEKPHPGHPRKYED
jgi:hypothetical protein